jgi:hypothetical protein
MLIATAVWYAAMNDTDGAWDTAYGSALAICAAVVCFVCSFLACCVTKVTAVSPI